MIATLFGHLILISVGSRWPIGKKRHCLVGMADNSPLITEFVGLSFCFYV